MNIEAARLELKKTVVHLQSIGYTAIPTQMLEFAGLNL
jgi:hypothetical protein